MRVIGESKRALNSTNSFTLEPTTKGTKLTYSCANARTARAYVRARMKNMAGPKGFDLIISSNGIHYAGNSLRYEKRARALNISPK